MVLQIVMLAFRAPVLGRSWSTHSDPFSAFGKICRSGETENSTEPTCGGNKTNPTEWCERLNCRPTERPKRVARTLPPSLPPTPLNSAWEAGKLISFICLYQNNCPFSFPNCQSSRSGLWIRAFVCAEIEGEKLRVNVGPPPNLALQPS